MNDLLGLFCWYIGTKQFLQPMLTNYQWGLVALTLKHPETHGCVVSTVATDALVLKHQAISILSAD